MPKKKGKQRAVSRNPKSASPESQKFNITNSLRKNVQFIEERGTPELSGGPDQFFANMQAGGPVGARPQPNHPQDPSRSPSRFPQIRHSPGTRAAIELMQEPVLVTPADAPGTSLRAAPLSPNDPIPFGPGAHQPDGTPARDFLDIMSKTPPPPSAPLSPSPAGLMPQPVSAPRNPTPPPVLPRAASAPRPPAPLPRTPPPVPASRPRRTRKSTKDSNYVYLVPQWPGFI